MRIKLLTALVTAVLIFAVLALVFFLHSVKNSEVLHSYPWHLTGRVFDTATNPLAGVNITVAATPRITGLDRLREHGAGTSPLTGTSDESGKFALDFTASVFGVTFAKPGFASHDLVFGPFVDRPPDTNPVLQVRLDPIPR